MTKVDRWKRVVLWIRDFVCCNSPSDPIVAEDDVKNPVIVNELINHNTQLEPVKQAQLESNVINGFDTMRNESESQSTDYETDKSSDETISEIAEILTDNIYHYELHSIGNLTMNRNVEIGDSSGIRCTARVVTLGECDVRGIPYTSGVESECPKKVEAAENEFIQLPESLKLFASELRAASAADIVNDTLNLLGGEEIH